MPIYPPASGGGGVPYVGATQDLDLGSHKITAQGISITGGTAVSLGRNQQPTVTVVYDPIGTLIAAGQPFCVLVLGHKAVAGYDLHEGMYHQNTTVPDNSGRNFYIQIDWVEQFADRAYEIIVGQVLGIPSQNNQPGYDAWFASPGQVTVNYGDGTPFGADVAQILPDSILPGSVSLQGQAVNLTGLSGTYIYDQQNIWLDAPANTIIQHSAPASPNDGDIWFDGADLKIRVAGVTKTFTLV